MIYNLVWFLLIGMLALSCKKEDLTKPTISIIDPKVTDSLSMSSQNIHITFDLSDNDELGELTYKIINDSLKTILHTKNESFKKEKSKHFHDHFSPEYPTQETPLTLSVTLTDKSGNEETQNLKFIIKP